MVTSTGIVSGMTTNIYPDGKSSMYLAGGTSAGTLTDPIFFHNFQIGNGSCDGDSDADDHTREKRTMFDCHTCSVTGGSVR